METRHIQTSELLLGRRGEIAEALVARGLAEHPEAPKRSLQDAGEHLAFLAQSLALRNRSLFVDYIAWSKVMLTRRKGSATELTFLLENTADVLRDSLPPSEGSLAVDFVQAAIKAMPAMPEDLPTFLTADAPLSPLAHQYFEALLRGERQVASRLVLDAVAAGTSVKEIYLHVFQSAQYEIGRLWQTNRITVAQEHYCTAATQLIMSQLYSHVFSSSKNGRTLIATCVAGDLHEIGVRMVADFFEMEGWDTFYLGANTPKADVVATVLEKQADVLAISATISYHVDAVRDLIVALRQNPDAREVVVLTGGYPFNQDPDLWQKVGADGSASNAQAAIELADKLLIKK